MNSDNEQSPQFRKQINNVCFTMTCQEQNELLISLLYEDTGQQYEIEIDSDFVKANASLNRYFKNVSDIYNQICSNIEAVTVQQNGVVNLRINDGKTLKNEVVLKGSKKSNLSMEIKLSNLEAIIKKQQKRLNSLKKKLNIRESISKELKIQKQQIFHLYNQLQKLSTNEKQKEKLKEEKEEGSKITKLTEFIRHPEQSECKHFKLPNSGKELLLKEVKGDHTMKTFICKNPITKGEIQQFKIKVVNMATTKSIMIGVTTKQGFNIGNINCPELNSKYCLEIGTGVYYDSYGTTYTNLANYLSYENDGHQVFGIKVDRNERIVIFSWQQNEQSQEYTVYVSHILAIYDEKQLFFFVGMYREGNLIRMI